MKDVKVREIIDDEYWVAQTTQTFSGYPEYLYYIGDGCYQLTSISCATSLNVDEIDQIKRTGCLGGFTDLKLVHVQKVFRINEGASYETSKCV